MRRALFLSHESLKQKWNERWVTDGLLSLLFANILFCWKERKVSKLFALSLFSTDQLINSPIEFGLKHFGLPQHFGPLDYWIVNNQGSRHKDTALGHYVIWLIKTRWITSCDHVFQISCYFLIFKQLSRRELHQPQPPWINPKFNLVSHIEGYRKIFQEDISK